MSTDTGTCDHAQAVPVESAIGGEVLAALCPGCDAQLPAEFLGCSHDNTIGINVLAEPPGRRHCLRCGTTGWYGAGSNRAGVLPTIASTSAPTWAELA